jgi:quinol monooxygenase YgiN
MSVQVVVSSHVADYDTWYGEFSDHVDVRKSHGATGHRVYQSLDDPGAIVVVTDFGDEAGARAFIADPSLRERMQRAGVDAPPDIKVVRETEALGY